MTLKYQTLPIFLLKRGGATSTKVENWCHLQNYYKIRRNGIIFISKTAKMQKNLSNFEILNIKGKFWCGGGTFTEIVQCPSICTATFRSVFDLIKT